MFSSTGSNHPIIPRQTDLLLSPHYVTFHSSDRDQTKYPSSSQWATRLPENVNNIRSMHLVDCYLPTKRMYVFKNDYQNLAFMVNINTDSSNNCYKEDSFEDNCLDQSKCTPRLNLSRPLVPHSNVKFNEDTKKHYAGPNNKGPWQIPTIQLQNSFSDPLKPNDNPCTSYQNNLKGLHNLHNNVCENKKITCQEPEPEPEPEPETKDCNIWAPRSMCAQQTAMLRVNGTIPPYIKKMREIEESVKPPDNYNYDGCHAYCKPTSSGCDQYMIRIKEGVYTGNELAQQLQLELKNATGFEWKVKFSEINGKFYFYVVDPKDIVFIQFRFDWKINYQCQNFCNKNQPIVWDNDHWWGLGYYLGFDKKAYTFHGTFTEHQLKKAEHPCKDSNQYDINLHSLQPPNIPQKELFLDEDGEKNDYYYGLVACKCANIEGPSVCYMEVEKYNNCDEIYHSSSNTSSTYNNTFSGATKALFAKLEIGPSLPGYEYFKTQIQYITHFKNQLEERINKLEFKFRFHDGRYVCFCDNKDMNFSIQFNCTQENPLSKLNITAIPGWST